MFHPDAPICVEALKSARVRDRVIAARALGYFRGGPHSRKVLASLVRGLNDDSDAVRSWCQISLRSQWKRVQCDDASELSAVVDAGLGRLLAHPQPRVRRAAVSVISHMPPQTAALVSPLLDLGDAPDLETRMTARKALAPFSSFLGAGCDAETVSTAIGVTEARRYAWEALAEHPSAESTTAFYAMGQYGSGGLPLLARALNHPSQAVRTIALVSLAWIGEPSYQVMLRALDDEDEDVVALAVTMMQFCGTQAYRELVLAVAHESECIRHAAVLSLGALGRLNCDVERVILDASWDHSPWVRYAALSALTDRRSTFPEPVRRRLEIAKEDSDRRISGLATLVLINLDNGWRKADISENGEVPD